MYLGCLLRGVMSVGAAVDGYCAAAGGHDVRHSHNTPSAKEPSCGLL
jgi:hypothetical protein